MKLNRLHVLTFIFLIIMGCSSGGGNPLVPSNQESSPSIANPPPDSLIYPHSVSNDGVGSGVGVFGVYNLHLNMTNLTAELTPIRNADALGAVYEADITSFLGSLCSDCLRVVGVALTEENNYLEVTFRLHHPIPVPADPFNPKISDRLDLHLFDVRGIIIAQGDRTFTGYKADVNGDGNIDEELKCNPSLLNNADGYTTFFDTYMDKHGFRTQANLHPYRLFFKDPRPGNYQPSINPVNGWITLSYPQGQNVFPQGDSTYDASYVFNIPPGSDFNLIMLLDACYGHSAQFAIPYPEPGSRMNPRYFLPEFHRKEAWLAFANITNNTLAYGNANGSATLSLTVYDWQAGLTGSGPLDYFTAGLSHLTATSDISEVVVFFPELLSDPLTEYVSRSGTGTWLDPYVYTFTLENQLDPEGGTYYGLIAIKDNLANAGFGPTGVSRDLGLVTITDFTNYQVFPIPIATVAPNQPPVAMYSTDPTPPEVNSGDFVAFDGTQSYDPDGEIILYEWDFEFGGLEFATDAEGAIPDPYQYFNPDPSMPTLRLALLRVTDNGDPPLKNMYGIPIVVRPNAPPVPIIEVHPGTRFSECDLVTLDASLSHDNTQIVTYEWDFDYNPAIPEFNIDATGAVVRRHFNPGARNVLLRVWDDNNINAITRVRLTSDPLQGNPGEVTFCDNSLLNEQDGKMSHSFASGGQRNVVLLPNWVVAAVWVDEEGFGGGPDIKYSFSYDGGRTFDPPMSANTTFISGDIQDLRPCLTGDSMGKLHLGYCDGDGTYYYQRTNGFIFGDKITAGSGSRTYGAPAISVDMMGNVYYFFTGPEAAGNVPLILAQSTDGGNSFNSPVTLFNDGRCPSAAASPYGSSILAFEGKNVPLGDSSDILVSYQRLGTTFYPPIRVVDSNPNDGKSTNPSLAVSPFGSVYIAWQDSRRGDTDQDYDIFYTYSLSGLSFSQNIRVNNSVERPGSQILQDFPSIGVDMMGAPYITWRDYRDGAGGDIYFAYSRLPGIAIADNVKINDDVFSLPIVTQGPPSILVSSNSGILIMWGDERNTTDDLGSPFVGPSDIYYTFGKLF